MIQEGYFLRGSVTIGDILIDGATVFGPALVRGYSLESEFAVYPRIVIDPIVFKELESNGLLRNKNHDLEAEQGEIGQLVHRDSDGLYFIDYLRASLSEFDKEGQEIEFLAKHKEVVLRRGLAHKDLTKIAAKILWVATYHNSVIREIGAENFSNGGMDINDYLISNQELALVVNLE